MAIIEWRPEYDMGVRSIDEQHRQMIALLEKLHQSFRQGRKTAHATSGPILAELVAFAQVHFREEEVLMRQAGYPDMAEHIRLHADLVAVLVEHIEQYKWRRLSPMKLALFIRDWIVNHMMEEDRKLAEFVIERGGK